MAAINLMTRRKCLSLHGRRIVARADRLPDILFKAGERFDLPFNRPEQRVRFDVSSPLPSGGTARLVVWFEIRSGFLFLIEK